MTDADRWDADTERRVAVMRYARAAELGRPLTAWERFWTGFRTRLDRTNPHSPMTFGS